jgi:hypothetical protein
MSKPTGLLKFFQPQPGGAVSSVFSQPITTTFDTIVRDRKAKQNEACHILGISMGNGGAGRPSARTILCRVAVTNAVRQWEADEGKSIQDILVAQNADLVPVIYGGLYLEKHKKSGLPVSGDMEDVDDEEEKDKDDGDDAENRGLKQTAIVKFLERALCHNWCKNGTHHSFVTACGLQSRVKLLLALTMSSAAAYRWLDIEKQAYDKGYGHRKQPNVIDWMDVLQSKRPISFVAEPPSFRENCELKFKEEWYDKLRAAINELEGVRGFGPELVMALAADIMATWGRCRTSGCFGSCPPRWTPLSAYDG